MLTAELKKLLERKKRNQTKSELVQTPDEAELVQTPDQAK